jgi:hypothetical protein
MLYYPQLNNAFANQQSQFSLPQPHPQIQPIQRQLDTNSLLKSLLSEFQNNNQMNSIQSVVPLNLQEKPSGNLRRKEYLDFKKENI